MNIKSILLGKRTGKNATRSRAGTFFLLLFLLILGAFTGLPFLYAIMQSLKPMEEIFIFPHMPVLYLATERRRATFTAVQWFDVSTDQAVAEDIEVLKEKRPVVLVLCFIPDSVREAHEQSFREGQKSGLTKMQEFLCRFVEEENYILLSSDTVSAEYTIEVYRLPESGE